MLVYSMWVHCNKVSTGTKVIYRILLPGTCKLNDCFHHERVHAVTSTLRIN